MSESGFVYALINPSLDGLVKVGMTTRTPEERAKEISASTGVPTPFVVAFYEAFHDCASAEEYVHAKLESHGYRYSKNREFFAVGLNIVINAIIEAKSALDKSGISEGASLRHSTDKGGNRVDTVSDNEAALFCLEDEKYLLVFNLCYRLTELLKDADAGFSEHFSKEATPEQKLKVPEFKTKFEEYAKGLESALRSGEEELLKYWELIQSVLPRLLDMVALDDLETELAEDYVETINALSNAAHIAGNTQGVLPLAITIAYAMGLLRKTLQLIPENGVDDSPGDIREEMRTVYEEMRPAMKMLQDSLLGVLSTAQQCALVVSEIATEGDIESLDELQISALCAMEDHEYTELALIYAQLLVMGTVQGLLTSEQGDDEYTSNHKTYYSKPWHNVLEEADTCLYGDDETVPDERRALELYKCAAKLGSSEAYLKIADLLASGDGTVNGEKKGVEWLNEGAKRGFLSCILDLADIYAGRNLYFQKSLLNRDNAIRCYRRFFGKADVKDFNDRDIYFRLKQYLKAVRGNPKEIDMKIIAKFLDGFRSHIQTDCIITEEDRAAKLDQLDVLCK